MIAPNVQHQVHYPYIELADIYAALAFAGEALKERELPFAAA
ncbi:DUF433 domain-containing protein [Myceligenerans halotolerans]